ncbi:MAG: ABC transporter permease subunit [Acidimicrobiales bacterium]
MLSAFSYPYVYLPVAARLAELPPSLEESARLLGRGPRQVFTSVVLPQARTAVAAGTLLVFLYTISDFGAVSIMGAPTLTNEIFQAKLVPELPAQPLASLLGAVALVVVAAERALARRRVAVSGVQVRRAMQVPLGRWRWPVALVVWGWFGAALAAPVLVLVLWVVRGVLGAGSPRPPCWLRAACWRRRRAPSV